MTDNRTGTASIGKASVVAAAIGIALAAPAAATAAQDHWKYSSLAANARDAGPSHSSFSSSAAAADSTSHKMRAGAHYPGGWTQYAGFAEAWGVACHNYNSTQELGPLIENPHSVSQNPVAGVSGYGGGAGSGCGPGFAAVAGASLLQAGGPAPAAQPLASQFALLRDHPSASLPDSIGALLGASHGSSAWAIDTASGRGWVVSVNSQQLCLAVPDPIEGFGATCSTAADVARRGLWLRIGGIRADGMVIDTIVAPDDATVVGSDGSAIATDVGVASRVIPETEALAIRR